MRFKRGFAGKALAVTVSAATIAAMPFAGFGRNGGISPIAAEAAETGGSGSYDVKYAVCIWGINQDVDKDGNTLGLTFGPATGASYVSTNKACNGTSELNKGNCMHWMTWDEIIQKSKDDPTQFQACLENGCTHSVELSFPEGSKIKGTVSSNMTGDGAGILYKSIASNYRKWNNDGYNYGGWPASRIRAMLNGSDQYTADGTGVQIPTGGWDWLQDESINNDIAEDAKDSIAGEDMQSFAESDTLISAFPAELRDAIVAKAVRSDTKYDTEDDDNPKYDEEHGKYNVTTYDKLWLFSGREVRSGNTTTNDVRPNEGIHGKGETVFAGWNTQQDGNGTTYQPKELVTLSGDLDLYAKWENLPGEITPYQRSTNLGITTSSYSNLKNYIENGSAGWWWLRSPSRRSSNSVYYVRSSGAWYDSIADSTNGGVAPGFCIGKIGETEGSQDPPSVKYAVSVWGIDQDVDEQGNPLGLTFGPATGDDYTTKYKSHTPTGQTTKGNDHRCIHNDSWETIISWSKDKDDPYVYEQCLKEGCTKSVDLDLRGMEIATDGYKDGTTVWEKDGDGAGILYKSIAADYRRWNAQMDSEMGYNYGGWPASRMRAMLNGSDVYTADGTDVQAPSGGYTDTSQYNNIVAGTDMASFTEGDALISAFPQELKSNIVAKAVKSDTKYDDVSGYNVTTYDKLWLFSGAEVYGDSGTNNGVIRANEGKLYKRSTQLGITTSSSSNLKSYNESGSAEWWWLRSPNRYSNGGVYCVYGSGDWGSGSASITDGGVAPGFCLK